jgi:hypothetical protein
MVDLATAFTTLKTIGAVLKKANDVELLAQLGDLQGALYETAEENRKLRDKIRDLEESARISAELTPEENVYWQGSSRAESAGPFCTRCWDADHKLVRIQWWHQRTWHSARCPACKTVVRAGAPIPPGTVDYRG